MRAIRGTLLLLAALAVGCAPLAPVPAYRNPVLARDFPDPAALRAPDGWVYAYATQGEHAGRIINIQVARSRDLVAWDYLGDALPAKPRWGATKQRFWAPHVIYDDSLGKYFMYYSAEPDGDKGTCLAIATAVAPGGPFTDMGAPLLCGPGIEHIDPMAFDDPRSGKRLLYWGSGRKPIKVRELIRERTGFAPGSVALDILHASETKPYHALVEGAWMTYRDGTYYLYYSGDRCCSKDPRYAVMVARAPSALGPFEPAASPVLVAGPQWLAPGHNSVVTDDAGEDWIVYHAYRAGHLSARIMLIDRLEYRDGLPSVYAGQPSAEEMPAPRFRARRSSATR